MDLFKIGSNIASMQALNSLYKLNSKLSVHQERLSTGKRVNSAQDDTAAYSIASSLKTAIRSNNSYSRNASNAEAVLNILDSSMQKQLEILQRLKTIAVQGMDTTLNSDQLNSLKSQANNLVQELNAIADSTSFNGTALMNAAKTLTFKVGDSSDQDISISLKNLKAGANTEVFSDSLNFSAGVGSDSATTGTLENGKAYYLEVSGTFRITNLGLMDSQYNIKTNTGAFVYQKWTDNTGYWNWNGSQIGNFDSEEGTYQADNTYRYNFTGRGATETFSYDDSHASGDNDGQLNLKVYEDGGEFSDLVKLDDTSGSGSLGDSASITNIDSAITTIIAEIQNVGSTQDRLINRKEFIDTKNEKVEAVRSTYEDADFAKEQMELMKVQILQQTATAALAQANAAPQSVLSMFR